MEFILASNNQKKLAEMQRILSPLGIEVKTAAMLELELPDVVEDGDTFEANAALKARSACQVTGLPAIADDSGLCVDYLEGAPGIYSARFSGGHGNDEANNDLLLQKLEGVPMEQRTAYYVCAICCVFPDGEELTVRLRHSKTETPARFYPEGTGGRLELLTPARAPTPGQLAVLYRGDWVLGSLWITRARRIPG